MRIFSIPKRARRAVACCIGAMALSFGSAPIHTATVNVSDDFSAFLVRICGFGEMQVATLISETSHDAPQPPKPTENAQGCHLACFDNRRRKARYRF
jgi:hypothetical protein